MRILLIHEDRREPGQGGGAESLLRDQAEALRRLGHTVAWWQGQGTVQQAVEAFKPDVVHVMTVHNLLPNWQASVRWLQEQKVPHVWALMDYWPICGNRNLLPNYPHGPSCSAVTGVCNGNCTSGKAPADWLALVNGSPVVALNAYTAAIYRRNGLRCDYVVELGIDTDAFCPPSQRDWKRASIYTSSAWPQVPVKGMQVVRQATRNSAHTVLCLAHLTRAEVARGLKDATIYLFPSIYEETWGLCLTEAMASGCACIASNVAGVKAQIQGGWTGLLVTPGDASTLRDCLDWLVANPEEAEGLGNNARAHVEKEHSLEAMGKRLERVYHEVTHGRQNLSAVG